MLRKKGVEARQKWYHKNENVGGQTWTDRHVMHHSGIKSCRFRANLLSNKSGKTMCPSGQLSHVVETYNEKMTMSTAISPFLCMLHRTMNKAISISYTERPLRTLSLAFWVLKSTLKEQKLGVKTTTAQELPLSILQTLTKKKFFFPHTMCFAVNYILRASCVAIWRQYHAICQIFF